jgi:hypothetical protein
MGPLTHPEAARSPFYGPPIIARHKNAGKTATFLLFSLYNCVALPYHQVGQKRAQTFLDDFV